MSTSFLSEARFVRQTGGMGMFAVVVLAWHPSDTFQLQNPLSEDILPAYFTPALEAGIKKVIGDKPARVLVVDALWHAVDSSPTSFTVAGRMAADAAKPRLSGLIGPPETRTPLELLECWRKEQQTLLASFVESVTKELDEFCRVPNQHIWWRSGDQAKIEKLVRITCNTPKIPSLVDLQLSISCRPLLELLGEACWRENPDQLPQELGRIHLRNLAQRDRWRLDYLDWGSLFLAWREHGLPYFKEHDHLQSLLSIGGYVDKGTRAALCLLNGRRKAARELVADGLGSSLGHPRQRRYCERVKQALND